MFGSRCQRGVLRSGFRVFKFSRSSAYQIPMQSQPCFDQHKQQGTWQLCLTLLNSDTQGLHEVIDCISPCCLLFIAPSPPQLVGPEWAVKRNIQGGLFYV